MPRKNKILIRTGSTAPTASDFDTSEPAWDSTGKRLYIKAADGTMAEIPANVAVSQISDLAAGANAAVRMYLWQTFR